MKTRFFSCFPLFFLLAVSGCATHTDMAFKNDAERFTEKSKPVYLMTATIKNTYRTSFQPRLLVVHVEKPNAKETVDRLAFVIDAKAKNGIESPNTGNSYLLRLELEPGQYVIRGLSCLTKPFMIRGSFFAPMHSDLEVKDHGIFYLGHVTATVRERQGNEFKAGASIPLIDQAVVGASGGTFDIVITDEFATDEPTFRAKFPALVDVPITKAILPAFDRAKAQKWWEEH